MFSFYLTILAPLALLGVLVGFLILKQVKDIISGDSRLNNANYLKAELKNPYDGSRQSIYASAASIYLLALKLMYLSLARKSLELYNCGDAAQGYFFNVEPSRKCYVETWWWAVIVVYFFT